ncbi:uncharacterized protein MELLADRAFT_111614 [Melampsora larici-populina 98AG31]|uniref:F-box domain-containing protein n=1 Tax=Melampsora larici-populina (strain 98AG31 / pathotype 3-4-7) TaxID=747676 RepID=F4S3S3_MELLP|nr:uncharacterized protein MELLADRAFT_111614 [Melampsora larici-populina 98AG31]EGG00724.1 hypothetical protein MELLADRAFT_111614 [Melampsora larici-populina 98AG31]
MSFANFPVEIVHLILSKAVLEGDRPIAQINRLPQNGEARDNIVLARLLLLNKDLSEFLKGIMWKRIGLTRLNKREPIAIDYFRKVSKLYQIHKHYTKSINISLRFATRELIKPKPEDEELIDIANDIFKASQPDQINEVILWVAVPPTLPSSTIEQFWERIHPILDTVTGFKNLTRFEFWFSRRLEETKLAVVISHLKNLEVVKLYARHKGLKSVEESEFQEDLGISLSSLTKLKSLSLGRLKSPNPSWIKLNWKSNIEKLSIFKCKRFQDFSSLKIFFHLFHKTLRALRFDVVENDDRIFKECEILESFRSLKQLTIFQYHHRNTSILQQFSICPAIKSINWVVSDLHSSSERISSLIYNLLITRNYQNRWRSLRSLTLPLSFAVSMDDSTDTVLDILCKKYSVRLNYSDHDGYDMV